MAGAAMPMRDTTTWAIAWRAAARDSPSRFPSSSRMGIPSLSSLRGTDRGRSHRWGGVGTARLLSHLHAPGLPPRGSGRSRGWARGAYLCLIKGMLMQFAAATAAKGTKRPMMGGKCWRDGGRRRVRTGGGA